MRLVDPKYLTPRGYRFHHANRYLHHPAKRGKDAYSARAIRNSQGSQMTPYGPHSDPLMDPIIRVMSIVITMLMLILLW